MAIYGQLIGNGQLAARQVSLAELLDRHSAARNIELRVNLEMLSLDPSAIVNITAAAENWGAAKVLRRLGRLASLTISGSKELSAVIEDFHSVQRLGVLDQLCDVFERQEGHGCILPHSGGGGFYGAGFFRSSPAYVFVPSASRVVEVPTQCLALESDGLLCERGALNLYSHSGFDSGLTGWTTSGTGVNGSAIATDTNGLLFDPAIQSGVPTCILLTAGTPHTANMAAWETTVSLSSGTFLSVGIDHLEETSNPLYYFIRRVFDNTFWNGSAFAAPVVYNALSVRSSHQQRPEIIGNVPVGGSGSTFEVGVGYPNGAASGARGRCYHVQVENQRWLSSRLLSFGGGFTREESDYCYANESARRLWPATRGTALFRAVPHWSTAQADGASFYVLHVAYDANNEITLYYDGATSTKNRFVASRKAGGSTATAAGAVTITAETPVYVAMRWGGTDESSVIGGDFDLWAGPSGALTKLATGTGSTPTESTDSRVRIGGKDRECFEGRVSLVRIEPRVVSDQEIQRWAS
jgi:hypothetical protein